MPKDCLRTKHARLTCDRCGGPADHMPLKLVGWFCAACCPACRPQGQAAGAAGEHTSFERRKQIESCPS